MKNIVIILTIALSLIACTRPGSKLIGKWTVESSLSKYFGQKSGDGPAEIVEFTSTEEIGHGKRLQVELADQGNDVVVYQTIFGTKFGETYKFIDKNTFVLNSPFDKKVFHRVN